MNHLILAVLTAAPGAATGVPEAEAPSWVNTVGIIGLFVFIIGLAVAWGGFRMTAGAKRGSISQALSESGVMAIGLVWVVLGLGGGILWVVLSGGIDTVFTG